MSFSWAKIVKSEPVKLDDIVSEEVARNVQAKEEKKCWMKLDDKISTAEVNGTSSPEKITLGDSGSNSNKEFDQLECAEEKCSDSGVDNCRRLSLIDDFGGDLEQEEIVDIGDETDWDTFDPLDKEPTCASQRVFKKNTKIEITDCASIKGGKNACKLSSKVFNSLELSAYNEEFRSYKVHRDKTKRPITKCLSVDPHAWRLIREMVKDRVINKVFGINSFSKDAVTLQGNFSWTLYVKKTSSTSEDPCLIKVFKVNLKAGKGHAAACRKAEKEVAIYKRLTAAGIRCPTVVALKEHVLVTSYPGRILTDLDKPCTRGNNKYYWHGTLGTIYDQVRDMMKKFYKAHLIHTDLLEHSILSDWPGVYIINVSQCVETSHKNAFDYLFRGCTNIYNIFKKKGVQDMVEPDDNFFYITGYHYLNKRSKSQELVNPQNK